VTTLIINPSSIISTYCYSIYRVETDSTCELSCRYCYARWYRITNRKILSRHLEEFRRFVKHVRDTYHRAPVFRMSTLVEPLQDRALVRAKHVLRLCNICEIPLILNTKSRNILKEEILEELLKLSEKNLLLVQVSICTLDENKARILEPRAPSPSQRVETIDILRQHGIRTVLRYQPTIPGIADTEYSQIVKLCRELSINHIIIEPLRIEMTLLNKLKEQIPELGNTEWEPYTELGAGIVRPCDAWTRKIIERFRQEVDRYSIGLATCKDPKINMLHRAEDCCGIYMINRERSLKKATIYELRRYNLQVNNVDALLESIEKISEEFIGRTYMSKIPKEHRKKIKTHYRILLQKAYRQDIETLISQ